MIYDVLPEDLKDIRETNGLSQSAMAKIVDRSLSVWQKYEQGDSLPSHDVLDALSEKFGIEFRISSKKRHPLINKKRASS